MDETKDGVGEAVGYGQPPKASQFKKGQSGNPRGRPRKTPGRRAIATRVLGEMQRLSGQPRGTRVRYTTLEIIVMTLKQLTAAGQARAASLYMRFAERYGDQETAHHQIGYAVVPEPAHGGRVGGTLLAEGSSAGAGRGRLGPDMPLWRAAGSPRARRHVVAGRRSMLRWLSDGHERLNREVRDAARRLRTSP